MPSRTKPTPSEEPISELQYLKGVGPANAKLLMKAGIQSVEDLLFYFPRRYEDRSNLPAIRHLRAGEFATVRGRIIGFESRPIRGGRVIIKAAVSDGTGTLQLSWFNQAWVARKLQGYKGDLIAYGQVKESGFALEIANPEYELLDEEDEGEGFARIMPVYPLTEGVHQKLIRKAIQSALNSALGKLSEPLPPSILKKNQLPGIEWSIRQMHQPDSLKSAEQARQRFVFEDFFYMQVTMALRRAEIKATEGIAFPIGTLSDYKSAAQNLFHVEHQTDLETEIKRMLPFELTNAQKRVIQEIWRDMELPHPMNRLVQGDVGAGKTAVAACAILAAIRCGYQCALMAPTEILAEQHFANFNRLFDTLGLEAELFVGKLTAKNKQKAISRLKDGQVQLAIGTHALIQDSIDFANLGLVVIDEQHRFGVLQRAALREKSHLQPDVLVMTATPIPRTLTMTVYGDLAVSILDELPPGRKPIKTHWKPVDQRDQVYSTVRKLVDQGRQAYFVCPMVAESEKLQALAAEDLHYRLSEQIYPDLRVGLIHGQMPAAAKEEEMEHFRRGEIQILVSTTVIEVGVDVPNASVMVIEDAYRFGLSQLHQLRGRVGRGEHQSFCVLISEAKSEDAQSRMQIMVETSDGFRIAEEDLKLRGPGELYGTRQSGNLDFRVADLIKDSKMLEIARQAAIDLIDSDPTLSKAEHQSLLGKVRGHDSELSRIVAS